MPKLKALSGQDIITILAVFGFAVAGQRGSHVKLQRTMNGIKQTLIVPNHAELDKGTVQAVYRQSTRYISESELRPHFYTK